MPSSQVVKLRPDYADGYTNIGLTNILWEKYGSARASLEKALELSPNNARALYYMALVERGRERPCGSGGPVEKVVAQYPRSRDARRELGVILLPAKAARSQQSSLRRCRPSIRMTCPRTTTWLFCTAAWE
jgi:tetratricopeptide (TPR) repeat protein